MVAAVLNSKGGSGKTTLATSLARGFQLEGLSVLIADADPQGNAQTWHSIGPDSLPPVIGITEGTLRDHLSDVGSAFDVVVIDGAAKLQQMSVAALKAADIVLIPVRPSAADLWAVSDLVDFIHTRQELTDGKPRATFVVSQQIVGINLASEVGEALQTYDLSVLGGRTSQRVAYAEALSEGTTVLDMYRRGRPLRRFARSQRKR